MGHLPRSLIVLLCVTASSVSLAQIGVPYSYTVESVTIEDLGSLGYGSTNPTDINDAGDVVGRSWTSSGVGQAFLFRNGVMQNVGSSAGWQASYGWGINNLGEVVGAYHEPDADYSRAFYWKEGVGRVTLSTSIHPGERFDSEYLGGALAIDDSGRITGRVYESEIPNNIPSDVCYSEVPVLWANKDALPQILYCADPSPSRNLGRGINNSGWIVGEEDNTVDRGFIWKNGAVTFVPKPSGAGSGLATIAINEAGVVAGKVRHGSVDRAIVWDGVSATAKWLVGSQAGIESAANDINDLKFTAGTSDTWVLSGDLFHVRDRAFIQHASFGIYHLPLPRGFAALTTNCAGAALNNRDASTGRIQVVGQCKSTNSPSPTRGFRWNVIVKKQILYPGPL